MAESQRPAALYNISGEARAEFRLFDLRDRIRNGMLNPQDQIAIVGTDIWKPASDFPELRRYFSLLKPAAAPGAAPVTGGHAPAASMGRRVIAGVIYPFTAITSIVIIIAAVIIVAAALRRGVNPLVSIVFSILAIVYALGVIRKSSEGQTVAPSAAEVGTITEWIMTYLRVFAVSLISSWPLIVAAILFITGLARSVVLLRIAAVVTLLYYPASLATVAIWKSIQIALSVQQIFRFIGILGRDYFAVIAIWFLTFFAITFGLSLIHLTLVSTRLIHLTMASSRLFVTIKTGAHAWSTLYASHLLGWAVYRHRDEL